MKYLASTAIPASAFDAFSWHERPGALERLLPPWERTTVLAREGDLRSGRVELQTHVGPLPVHLSVRHGGYVPGVQFVDEQIKGPFRRWRHTHRFTAHGERSSVLDDLVEYELPGGRLGERLGSSQMAHRLKRMFDYRHATLLNDLDRHLSVGAAPQRIAVSGASGLIGRALVAFLSTGGHQVLRLVRHRPTATGEVYFNPDAGEIDGAALEGLDAVIHLGAENIGARWNKTRKARILESRVRGTRLLAEALALRARPPRVFISISAVGYYGEHGRGLDEAAPSGSDFLADVCRQWEAAAEPARSRGIRVVHPRLGMVLSPAGGALQKLIGPFKMGMGGRVGDGRQWMSWVALDDVLYALHHLLFDEKSAGAVNVVAPGAVQNAEFTQVLAQLLWRPALLPLPSAAVSLLFGEMGRTLLLSGAEVLPTRLREAGFTFRFPTLETALAHLLGKSVVSPPLLAAPPMRP